MLDGYTHSSLPGLAASCLIQEVVSLLRACAQCHSEGHSKSSKCSGSAIKAVCSISRGSCGETGSSLRSQGDGMHSWNLCSFFGYPGCLFTYLPGLDYRWALGSVCLSVWQSLRIMVSRVSLYFGLGGYLFVYLKFSMIRQHIFYLGLSQRKSTAR